MDHRQGDLVLSRLLDDVEELSLREVAPEQVVAEIVDGADATLPVPCVLRSADNAGLFKQRIASDAPLLEVDCGGAAIVALHLQPHRRIELDDETVLLSAYRVEERLGIVEARWAVTRAANRRPVAVSEISFDDYSLPRDRDRLLDRLESLALATRFQPIRPTVRIAAVVSATVGAELQGVEDRLVAAAAVRGCEVDVVRAGDPRTDSSVPERTRKAVLHNRFSGVLLLSHPKDRWVSRLFADLRKHRAVQRLPFDSMESALGATRTASESFVDAAPTVPTLAWGQDAEARIRSRCGVAFDLSDQACRHLRKNSYPKVERMIQHLEMLAEAAQEWHDSGGKLDGRFEDWILSEHDLTVAMRDKGISPTQSTFTHDGRTLSNQPHVKVDDAVARSDCGRIYFGLCAEMRQIVVDYIGIHDRS